MFVTRIVPWGIVRVDGTRLTLPADRLGLPLPLPKAFGRGRHQVEYQATPFPTLHCTFSVPAAPSEDTCPLASDAYTDPSLGEVRTLDLGVTPDALPPDQRLLLQQAVAAAFADTPGRATVAAGDHYLGPAGAAAVARDPLQATLYFTLNTDPARSL